MEKILTKKLILASKSPRRQELIKKLGLPYEIVPSNYDEQLRGKKFSDELIETVSRNKALDTAEQLKDLNEDAYIIGADTVVVLGDEILLKPLDEQDAANMLNKLSGKTHKVVTGITVLDLKTRKYISTAVTSEVTFETLSDEQITNYIKTKRPMDKAGAYGIQELDKSFVKSFTGSKDNIIGLCPYSLKLSLSKLDKILS